MYLNHTPQCSIQNRNAHISVLNGALWDMEQVHSGTSIFQTTFWNGFSSMEMYEFRLRFHWSLFPWVQLIIFQHWFRKWVSAGQATRHYRKQWWPNSLTQICFTQPQWDNSISLYIHNVIIISWLSDYVVDDFVTVYVDKNMACTIIKIHCGIVTSYGVYTSICCHSPI